MNVCHHSAAWLGRSSPAHLWRGMIERDMSLKEIIKRRLLRHGFEVRALSPQTNSALQLARLLDKYGFDVVFDVGANVGQFGDDLRRYGYNQRIVSFEPIASVHAQLCAHVRSDTKWTVHPACALGAATGATTINVSGNLYSSSLLPMHDSHAQAAPESVYVRHETVHVDTLDNVAPAYLDSAGRAFLKIDTQGFEAPILDGAGAVLPRIEGVLLEMSLVELYTGQALWLELLERMKREGFELWGLAQGFVDPRTLRTLQVDGIFLRAGVTHSGA